MDIKLVFHSSTRQINIKLFNNFFMSYCLPH